MAGDLTVEIKRQPFDPPFVLQIGGEEVRARIRRLDDEGVAARIDGRGTYRIDVTGVGFWFVERKAEPYGPGGVLPEARGCILERTMAAVARAVRRYRTAVAAGFRGLRNLLSRRGRWLRRGT